jgi:hypothetical protein
MNIFEPAVIEDLIRVAPHIEIVQHIPGRVKLRLRTSGLFLIRKLNPKELTRSLSGIKRVKLNPFSRSLDVEYDCRQLPADTWELINQLKRRPELTPDVAKLLGSLCA